MNEPFRVVCLDSSPCNPGLSLVAMKSYYVEGFIRIDGGQPRYLLSGLPGSWPLNRFITGTEEHELEMEIFKALNENTHLS